MRTWILALGLVALIAAPAAAKHVRFMGPHPIAAKFGGGYCYIEAPHVHLYAPDRPALYGEVDGNFVFTGDPTPFGYDGPKFTFYGHHPIAGAPGVYCYLDGPHYHPYAPPETPEYKVEKGVAFYVGPYDPVYFREKPHKVKLVQAEYRPYVAVRTTGEVAPPPEWRGEVWVAPPTVEVGAPGVVVAPPAPQVVVAPPAPQVVVAPPAPHVYVAPPAPHVYVAPPAPHVYVAPPAPHVVVGAPPPVVVGVPRPHGAVVVGAPAPVVVGAPGVVVHERGHGEWKEHHDHGKHKGWYK